MRLITHRLVIGSMAILLTTICTVTSGSDPDPCLGDRFAYEGDVVPVTANPSSPNIPGWTASPINDGVFDMTGLSASGGNLHFSNWPYPHALFTPSGVFSSFTGAGNVLETRLQVTSGRLFFVLYDGERQFQIMFAPNRVTWLKLSPPEAPFFETDLTVMQTYHFVLSRGRIRIYEDGVLRLDDDMGSGSATGASLLQFIALSPDFPPTASLDYARVCNFDDLPPDRPLQPTESPRTGFKADLNSASVDAGDVRKVTLGSDSPWMMRLQGGTVLLTSLSETGSESAISTDDGLQWRLGGPRIDAPTVQLEDGTLLKLEPAVEVLDTESGLYRVTRFLAPDGTTPFGDALLDGTLELPPGEFNPELEHRFHGNPVLLSGGRLLATVDGELAASGPQRRRISIVFSDDDGVTWQFLAHAASSLTIVDPSGRLASSEWPLIGAAEPAMARMPNGRLLLVASTVDDSGTLPANLRGAESETYGNLFEQIDGGSLLGRVVGVRSDRYYEPGPDYPPLITAYSDDGGQTWSPSVPMAEARGVAPAITVSPDGFVALAFSSLRGLPRMGTGAVFSSNNGVSWSDMVIVSPWVTTGRCSVVARGEGEFMLAVEGGPFHGQLNRDARWVDLVSLFVERADIMPNGWSISAIPVGARETANGELQR